MVNFFLLISSMFRMQLLDAYDEQLFRMQLCIIEVSEQIASLLWLEE